MDYFSGELECRQVIERARPPGRRKPAPTCSGRASSTINTNFNINVKGKRAEVPAPHRLYGFRNQTLVVSSVLKKFSSWPATFTSPEVVGLVPSFCMACQVQAKPSLPDSMPIDQQQRRQKIQVTV